MKRKLSKKILLGRTMAVAGFLLVAAGVAGLIWQPDGAPGRPGESAASADTTPRLSPPAVSPSPVATPAESAAAPSPSASAPASPDTPSAPEPPPSYSASRAEPDTRTYQLRAPNAPAADAPAFHRIARIEARQTENPASGAPSDALLVELPAVPDREFSVIAIVEADKPPSPGHPDAIDGLHWMMNYRDGQFAKSAARVASGTKTGAPADAFNTRYQGFGDRAEVEFYGPPGTRYYAVVITDGEFATFAAP